jgi:hypothetical protein
VQSEEDGEVEDDADDRRGDRREPPERLRLPRSFSTYGAPRKIQRKHGTKVTQATRRPPIRPPRSASTPPASRKAARNPT